MCLAPWYVDVLTQLHTTYRRYYRTREIIVVRICPIIEGTLLAANGLTRPPNDPFVVAYLLARKGGSPAANAKTGM